MLMVILLRLIPVGIINLYIMTSTLVAGSLYIEALPRVPYENDHVTLRCFVVPVKVRLLQDCRYEWELTIKQDSTDDEDEHNYEYQKSPRPAAAARLLQPATNIDIYDFGSLIVINELRNEHEGRYTCRLLCAGRRTESASIGLEIGKESGSEAAKENANIAYISSGVVFAIIILATVLRLSCSNPPECFRARRGGSSARSRRISRRSRNEAQLSISWSEGVSTPRTGNSPVWNKPKEPRRPTILANTVWLPPYEAAMKHSRILSSSSSTSSSGDSPGDSHPPTYEEALNLLRQQSLHNEDRSPQTDLDSLAMPPPTYRQQ